MGWFSRKRKRVASASEAHVISFTGGMGAQILSAAIYFDRMGQGLPTAADLSYFDKAPHLAQAGQPGDCSHWNWQLDALGLSVKDFQSASAQGLSRQNAYWVDDGAYKLELALGALSKSAVQQRFPMRADSCIPAVVKAMPAFLCIHVRRGDYVNVASHLVSDAEFDAVARRFAGLLQAVVVLSDSPIPDALKQGLQRSFPQCAFLDDVAAYTAHCIMRQSRVLLCSNSQFSLISALLNPDALVLMPKQWFGEGQRELEQPIHALSRFQALC
jgi:hypothetical protein